LEVKINREIRDYTESMFFGLSLRQFIFSVLAVIVAVGIYFGLRSFFGTDRPRLYSIPRHDGGAVFVGLCKIGISPAQAFDLSPDQYLLRSSEIHY